VITAFPHSVCGVGICATSVVGCSEDENRSSQGTILMSVERAQICPIFWVDLFNRQIHFRSGPTSHVGKQIIQCCLRYLDNDRICSYHLCLPVIHKRIGVFYLGKHESLLVDVGCSVILVCHHSSTFHWFSCEIIQYGCCDFSPKSWKGANI
jgi:hypothetical protein